MASCVTDTQTPRSRRIPEHIFVILDVDRFQVVEKSIGFFNQQHRAIVLLKYKQGELNIHVRILAEVAPEDSCFQNAI
jgi:hypothetical protein